MYHHYNTNHYIYPWSFCAVLQTVSHGVFIKQVFKQNVYKASVYKQSVYKASVYVYVSSQSVLNISLQFTPALLSQYCYDRSMTYTTVVSGYTDIITVATYSYSTKHNSSCR